MNLNTCTDKLTMRWLSVIFVFLFALNLDVAIRNDRQIASFSDIQLDRTLHETMEEMSYEALRYIEDTTSVALGMKNADLRIVIKEIISKIKQTVMNPVKAILFRNPDAVIFSTLFRIIKNSVVVSTLIYSGNAHLIPLVSGIFLNSDLWLGLYIIMRKGLANIYGKFHYGFSHKELQKVRDTIFQMTDTEFYSFHQVEINGAIVSVDIKRNLLRDKIRKVNESLRGKLTVKNLEEIIDDRFFLSKVGAYKGKPYLYNEILLAKIISDPEKTTVLLERLRPVNLVDKNLGLQQFLREVRLFANGIETFLIDFDERATSKIKESITQKVYQLNPRAVALKYDLRRFKKPMKKELVSLRILEYDLLAEYIKTGQVDLNLFQNKLNDSRFYLSQKMINLRLYEKNVAGIDDLVRIRNSFQQLMSMNGDCLFLLQRLF